MTRLLLCNGRISNVRTCCVRLFIPLAAMLEPVRTPPVVITTAPAVPPRNADVPVMPTVVRAPASPSPITGAKRPAERPMTNPPPEKKMNNNVYEENGLTLPIVASPSIIYRRLFPALRAPSTSNCCSNVSMSSCISSA